MHSAFFIAIILLSGTIIAIPAPGHRFPVKATIAATPGEQRADEELVGNVKVTFSDSRSEMWTRKGKCLKPRVAPSGHVGWTRFTARNHYGEPVNATLRTLSPGGRIRDFQAGPFIEDWGFYRGGAFVVIKSRGRHGSARCLLFDTDTGKQIGSVKSTEVKAQTLYVDLPSWAHPFADVMPPPAGSEADAVRKAQMMIQGFREGRLELDRHRKGHWGDSKIPVMWSGPEIYIEPLRWSENMGLVAMCGAELAKLGVAVLPQAFALLDEEHTYMRYIGAVTLNNLTGLEPLWYYFGHPLDEHGKPTAWAVKAKAQWLQWFAEKQAALAAEAVKKQAQSSD